MVKATYVDKNGVKKGAWTDEEDNKLRAYVLRYGHWNWRLLPKFAGLKRCGKSCRLRWMNYLKPGIKRGEFSQEERDLIEKLHLELGNKWSAIAAKLPGRTDNDIKNYWHTHLTNHENICITKSSKRAVISWKEQAKVGCVGNDVTSAATKSCSGKSKISSSSSSDVFILESSSVDRSVVSGAVDLDIDSSAEQNPCEILSTNPKTITDQDIGSFPDFLVSGFDESFWTEPFVLDTDSYTHDYNFCIFDEGYLLSHVLSFS